MTTPNVGTDQYILVTLRASRDEDGAIVSECLELQTASCGDDMEHAIEMVREATELYLEAITDSGDRERVFRERGVAILTSQPDHVDLRAHVHPGDLVRATVLRLPQPASV